MTGYHLTGLGLAACVGALAIWLKSDAGIGLASSMVSGILGHAQGSRQAQKRATDVQKGAQGG